MELIPRHRIAMPGNRRRTNRRAKNIKTGCASTIDKIGILSIDGHKTKTADSTCCQPFVFPAKRAGSIIDAHGLRTLDCYHGKRRHPWKSRPENRERSARVQMLSYPGSHEQTAHVQTLDDP